MVIKSIKGGEKDKSKSKSKQPYVSQKSVANLTPNNVDFDNLPNNAINYTEVFKSIEAKSEIFKQFIKKYGKKAFVNSKNFIYKNQKIIFVTLLIAYGITSFYLHRIYIIDFDNLKANIHNIKNLNDLVYYLNNRKNIVKYKNKWFVRRITFSDNFEYKKLDNLFSDAFTEIKESTNALSSVMKSNSKEIQKKENAMKTTKLIIKNLRYELFYMFNSNNLLRSIFSKKKNRMDGINNFIHVLYGDELYENKVNDKMKENLEAIVLKEFEIIKKLEEERKRKF